MEDSKRNITMAINDRCASSGCYEGDVYVEAMNTVWLHLTAEETKTILPILINNGLYVEVFDNEKEIDADYAKK